MQNFPPITKNLLIINVLCFLAQQVFEMRYGIYLSDYLGLHFFKADGFGIWQPVTYLFLHGDFIHLFSNMFSLWMFGRIIEQVLGQKRFLIYYFVCGVGAAFCQEVWQLIEYAQLGLHHYESVNTGMGIIPMAEFLNSNAWTTIGASGACYGVLLAFGFTFPNERIMLLLPPIPMKAKYFVVGYAAFELYAAFTSSGNIAHFAHLGGMLFGFLLLLKWRRDNRRRNGFTGWEEWKPKKKGFIDRMKDWMHRDKKRKPTMHYDRPAGSAFKDRGVDYDYNLRQRENQAKIDALLEKVKRSGYESLTDAEKKELFKQSSNGREA